MCRLGRRSARHRAADVGRPPVSLVSLRTALLASLLASCTARVEQRHAPPRLFRIAASARSPIELLRPLSQAAVPLGVDDVRWSWRAAAGPYSFQQCVDRACREIVQRNRTLEPVVRTALHAQAAYWRVCDETSCSRSRQIRSGFDARQADTAEGCDTSPFMLRNGRAVSCVRNLGRRSSYLDDGAIVPVREAPELDGESFPHWQPIGDVNGDGDDDLVRIYALRSSGIPRDQLLAPQVFLSSPTGYHYHREVGDAVGPSAQVESVGDLDDDGRAELVALPRTGVVQLLRSEDDQRLHRTDFPTRIHDDELLRGDSLRVRRGFDLDGDGMNDAIVDGADQSSDPVLVLGGREGVFRVSRGDVERFGALGEHVGDVTGDGIDERVLPGAWLQPPRDEAPAGAAPPDEELVLIDGATAAAEHPRVLARLRVPFERVDWFGRVGSEFDRRALVLLAGVIAEHPTQATPYHPTRTDAGAFPEVFDRTAHQLCELRRDVIRCAPAVYYPTTSPLFVLDVLSCLTGLRTEACGPWRPTLLQRGSTW